MNSLGSSLGSNSSGVVAGGMVAGGQDPNAQWQWFLDMQRKAALQAQLAQQQAEYDAAMGKAKSTADSARAQYMTQYGNPAYAQALSGSNGGVGGMGANSFAYNRANAILTKAQLQGQDVYDQTKVAEENKVKLNRFGQSSAAAGQPSSNQIVNNASDYTPQVQSDPKESTSSRIAQAGAGLYDLVNKLRQNNIGAQDIGRGAGQLVGGIFSAPAQLARGFASAFRL